MLFGGVMLASQRFRGPQEGLMPSSSDVPQYQGHRVGELGHAGMCWQSCVSIAPAHLILGVDISSSCLAWWGFPGLWEPGCRILGIWTKWTDCWSFPTLICDLICKCDSNCVRIQTAEYKGMDHFPDRKGPRLWDTPSLLQMLLSTLQLTLSWSFPHFFSVRRLFLT